MTDTNPFESPSSALDQQRDGSAEDDHIPLYSSEAVMIATFLGSPIAGAILVIANGRKDGKRLNNSVLYSVVFVLLFVALSIATAFLPFELPGIVFSVAGVLGMRMVNDSLFEEPLSHAKMMGLPFAPWWHALVLGFSCMALMLFGILGLGLMLFSAFSDVEANL